MELEILTKKQRISVKKELIIRRVFKKNGVLLPSANVVFDHVRNSNGKLEKIIAYGGGFGHGVGMSQYGAGFMATHLNKRFDEILKWYYSGISITTVPVVLSAKDSRSMFIQNFYAPKKSATLVVDNKSNVTNLNTAINGQKVNINLKSNALSDENVQRIDISRYIKNGKNTIKFYTPREIQAKNTIKLYVELF
jgi:hypothetical protein